MNQPTIVVLGGALAGPVAALAARRTNPHARVILVERRAKTQCGVPALAQVISGELPGLENLKGTSVEEFAEKEKVEVLSNRTCEEINPSKQYVTLSQDTKREQLHYDTLIFALGAAARFPQNAPTQATNLVSFRTLNDLQIIMRILENGEKRVVILGGGPFGLEAADALIRRGIRPTIIEQSSALLPQCSPEMSQEVESHIQGKAQILKNTTITGFTVEQQRITELQLANGERVAADLVIASIGLIPRTELLKSAGAKLAPNGTVLVDDTCRTSLPHIFACGVCISTPQVITGKSEWVAQAAVAQKTALVAGTNAAGRNLKLGPVVGSIILRVADLVVGRCGLTTEQVNASFQKSQIGSSLIRSRSRDPIFSDTAELCVNLTWSRSDHRILSVEVCGKHGVDKRVDAAAAAIRHGATLESLALLDFGYSSPFSAPEDPLNLAAYTAWQSAQS